MAFKVIVPSNDALPFGLLEKVRPLQSATEALAQGGLIIGI